MGVSLSLGMASVLASAADLTLSTGIEAGQMNQAISASQWTGMRIGAQFAQPWGRDLKAELKARALLQVGNFSTSVQSDDFRPRRDLELLEASVVFSPSGWTPFSIRAGALSQEHWDSPLFLGTVSFPGARQRFHLGTSYFATLEAQQAIPTGAGSLSAANPTTASLDSNAFLFMERLRTGYQAPSGAGFSLWVGHFSFQSLNAGLAGAAAWGGNSIVPLTSNQGIFSYAYDGFESGARLSLKSDSGMGLGLSAEGMTNIGAPQGASGAGRLALEVEIQGRIWGTPALVFRPGAEVFYVESDAVPALYNAKEYGHCNRRGWAAHLGFEWQPSGILLEGRYFSSNPVNPNLYQSPLENWSVELRKSYDIL